VKRQRSAKIFPQDGYL